VVAAVKWKLNPKMQISQAATFTSRWLGEEDGQDALAMVPRGEGIPRAILKAFSIWKNS